MCNSRFYSRIWRRAIASIACLRTNTRRRTDDGWRRRMARQRQPPTVMYRHSKENWAPDFMKRRPDVSTDVIEKYLHNLYAVQPDFLFSVWRDFIRDCRTPMLV